MAKPLDACLDLSNKVEKVSNITSPFALVIRGGCSFEEKVRRVQKAGFKAAIVYDNDDDGVLVTSNALFLWKTPFYIEWLKLLGVHFGKLGFLERYLGHKSNLLPIIIIGTLCKCIK